MNYRGVSHYEQVRTTNQRRLLAILGKTPATRSELAKMTGLSPATVTNLTRDLISLGLVRESERLESIGGRPPVLLEFNPNAGKAVGIRISRTQLQAGLVNLGGKVINYIERPLSSYTPKVVMEGMAVIIREVCAGESVDLSELVGVGVAVPGIVQEEEGLVSLSTVLNWREVPLGKELQECLGVPVVVQRNGNASALAEAYLGLDVVQPDLLYIHLGDGIGAGIVLSGYTHSGQMGRAGEIGHNIIDPSGPPCFCGNDGCLEAVASGKAIAAQGRRLAESGASPYLRELLSKSEFTSLEVIQAAKMGDKAAGGLLVRAGQYIGQAVAGLVNLLDISPVVFGGDLLTAGDFLLDPLVSSFKAALLPFEASNVTIRTSSLGPQAGVIGASSAMIQYFLFKGGKREKVVEKHLNRT